MDSTCRWQVRCMGNRRAVGRPSLSTPYRVDVPVPPQVRCIDLQEPQGWVVVPLPPDDNPE